MGTARRLHGCEPRHRPRTLAALRDFCTRAKLEIAKIYAVDPRDVVRDARDRGLVTSETCEQLLEHLRFAKAPDGSRKALLPTEWPSEAHFGWVRSLPKCHEAALAVWFLHAAHLLVTIALEDLLASVVAEGLCQFSDDTRTSDRPRLVCDVQVWAEPWTANEDPSLTVKSALLTALPETNCAFARVQEVRKEHDPAFERWMPHMNFIYPFLPSGLLQVEEVAAKLASAEPIEVVFNEIGHFDHGKSITLFLQPDQESVEKLRELYDLVVAALPAPPGGSWTPSEEEEEKGQGKGKGKGKGKARVKARERSRKRRQVKARERSRIRVRERTTERLRARTRAKGMSRKGKKSS